MSLPDLKDYNPSKLNEAEQAILQTLLSRIKSLVTSRVFLYSDGKATIRKACYGTQDPKTLPNPVEGQIYFQIFDTNKN